MLVNDEEYFRGEVEGDVVYGIQGPEGPRGHVGPTGKTAYEYSVEHGYEGTEEEFGFLTSNFADIISRGNESVKNAEEALDKATNATNAAEEAVHSAETVLAAATEISQRAETSVNNAEEAVRDAGRALSDANDALNIANSAETAAMKAIEDAGTAVDTASEANRNAQAAVADANTAIQNANTAVQNAEKSTADNNASRVALEERANEVIEEIRNVAISDSASAIIKDIKGDQININDSSFRLMRGLKVFGKTTQNGNPTPEVPVPLDSVGDDGSVNVMVSGKNLLGGNVKEVKEFDGYKEIVFNNPLPAGTYAVSGIVTSTDTDSTYSLFGFRQEETKSFVYANFGRTGSREKYLVEVKSPVNFIRMLSSNSIANSAGDTAIWTDVQIEVGSVATEYEPYKIQQTLSISTPNGLPGIPVSSGGNYTDDNGQQWVCDEVDFEKGQYIQRVRQVSVTRTTSSGNNLMVLENTAGSANPLNLLSSYTASRNLGRAADGTSIFVRGVENAGTNKINLTSSELNALLAVTPMELIYELAEPIETALTAEELAQYATLHTNYPNTTIFTDEGASMEVKYVVDTRTYIDTKFAELAAAILKIDLTGYMKAADYPTEKWSFTLDDGSVVEKDVVTG